MTVLAKWKWRFASLATFTAACAAGLPASAQFVPLQNYSQQAPPAYAQQVPGAYAQYPGAQHPMYAAPRVASAAVLPAPAEVINRAAPVPQAVRAVPPNYQAPVQQGYSQQQGYPQQAVTNYQAPASGYASSGCSSCQAAPAVSAAPTTSWEGYTGAPVASAGCATGNCGGGGYVTTGAAYPTASYGTSSYGAPACNVSSYVPAPKRQWFVGVYGLYMQRDNPGKALGAISIEDASTIGGTYYPDPAVDTFLFTTSADVDPQFGGEIRFGSTFGCADACGGGQPFAWEIGYWQLEEDSSMGVMTETGTVSAANTRRIVGMRNYAGLEFDPDGAAGANWAYRPLNDYAGYQIPVDGDPASTDIRVLGVRVRQRFEMKNLELNFWRFGHPTESAGLAGGGLGLGGRGLAGRGLGGRRLSGAPGCGAYGGGGSCGTGACGVGGACGPAACQPCRPPRRFFINGLAGLRYMKIDEDFALAQQFTVVDAAGDPLAGQPTSYLGTFPEGDVNTFFHDIEADNQLVGFQLGCSMNWLVGCKWNVFADTNLGVYGNQIDMYQRVYGGDNNGAIRFVGSGNGAAVRSSKTEASFMGEARLGVGYQVSCNCRLTAAYRIISLSGIALAQDQQTSFINEELLTHIDNNSSLVLQGLQTGVEWKY